MSDEETSVPIAAEWGLTPSRVRRRTLAAEAERDEAIAERDAALREVERLRTTLIGHYPDDPRWTWLPGAIERLREHAPADEDPDAMYECALTLEAMHAAIREALRAASPPKEAA